MEQRALQKTRQGVLEPPSGAAELLGTWSKIEVSLIEKPGFGTVAVMFDDIVINRIEPDGRFYGYGKSQGKAFSQSAGHIRDYPSLMNVRIYTLTGRIIKPGFARIRHVPCHSGLQFGYNLLSSPHIGEMSWEGRRMVGYDLNTSRQALDSYVAIKVV